MDHLWQINVAKLLIIIYSGLPKDMFFSIWQNICQF